MATNKLKRAARLAKTVRRREVGKGAKPAAPRSRVSNALLAGAIDLIRDYGIFLLDPNGNILTWNEGAARLKGYTEKEIIGQNFRIFYLPEDIARKHPDAELKEAKKTGRYEEEGWRKRKDGSRFWANIVITKIVDEKGSLLGFSKVTRDLTARKEMEEKLRESEERFRLLIENVRDYAIYMLDPQGYVTSWNQGAARIKGYDSKEIIGKHFSIFYSETDVKKGKCEYELNEAATTGRYEEEGWRYRKDGTRLWASVIVTAIHDSNGNLIGFAKVTRDLTEKKRAEDKLRRANTDLEQRVRERTNELTAANQSLAAREAELKEAVRVRDEFLSIASHELKTPITSLKMQMQMLRQKTNPEKGELPPPEKLAKGIDSSLRQVDRLTKLVEDLLDVARAQAQKVTFHMERAELRLLVLDVVDRLREQIEAAGCRIELDLKTVWGEFDRFRLDQVLVNLITNALKYAAGTKVTIRIRTEGTYATLQVIDEGSGISPDALSRLFERFERGPNAQNINGLGLGLFISRQIVEGHRGTIRAESVVGEGTTFTIRLPVQHEAALMSEVRE